MPEPTRVYLLSPPADSPYYHAQWTDPAGGRRVTRSLKTRDHEEGERRRARLEVQLADGVCSEGAGLGWGAFRKRYESEQLSGLREATRAKAATVLDHFEAFARPATVREVTEARLSGWAARMRADGRRPATIAGKLAYLRAALNWAEGQNLIAKAPRVKMPKVPKRRRFNVIDEGRFELLLVVCPDREWVRLLLTAWHTGMRRSELLAMEWSGRNGRPWPDFARARIILPAEYVKSDEDQWIPLHPDLAAELGKDRRRAGPMFAVSPSKNEVSRTFTELAESVGLDVKLHDLRRSFGTRYAPLVSAQVLQRLMRHADIRTTLEYYADLDGGLDDAIRLL